MTQSIDSHLGIWGNESCMQCGACCYEINQCYDKKSCDNIDKRIKKREIMKKRMKQNF